MKRWMCSALLVVVSIAPAASMRADFDGVKDVDEAWVKAMNDNDLAAVIALYHEDAVLYPPEQVEVRGAKAIAQYFGAVLGANTVKNVKMLDAKYQTDDDLSVGWGRFTLTVVPKSGGQETVIEGRFVAAAQKRDGKWRYIADHASVPMGPR